MVTENKDYTLRMKPEPKRQLSMLKEICQSGSSTMPRRVDGWRATKPIQLRLYSLLWTNGILRLAATLQAGRLAALQTAR